MKQMHKQLVLTFWVLVVIAIIVTSLLPNTYPPTEHNMDKVLHFGAYGFMAFLPALVIGSRRNLVWVAVFLLGVGAATEIGQYFVPERSCSWGDFAANTLGVVVGSFAGSFIRQFIGKRLGL